MRGRGCPALSTFGPGNPLVSGDIWDFPDLLGECRCPAAAIVSGDPPPHALAAGSRNAAGGGIPQPDRVRIRAWAEVAGHFTIDDPRTVDALSPFYVWTPDYAEKRLGWRRHQSLHVLLLRTHRIPRPVTVKVRDEYAASHPWVELQRDLPFEGTPVLSDAEFERASEEIRAITSEAGQPVLA